MVALRTTAPVRIPFRDKTNPCNVLLMPKRRRILLLLAVGLLLFSAAAFFVTRPREPSHGGRALSKWLDDYGRPELFVTFPKAPARAENAIRQIGTNAIPHLLTWIAYEQPAWKARWYFRLNPLLRRLNQNWILTDRQEARAERATGALQLLGPNAAGAIPRLTRMMYEARIGGTKLRASRALSSLGPQALPPLLATLTNSQPQVIMVGLSGLRGLGSNAAPAVPTILNLLASSNFFVRVSATNALRRIAPQVLTNAAKAPTPPPL